MYRYRNYSIIAVDGTVDVEGSNFDATGTSRAGDLKQALLNMRYNAKAKYGYENEGASNVSIYEQPAVDTKILPNFKVTKRVDKRFKTRTFSKKKRVYYKKKQKSGKKYRYVKQQHYETTNTETNEVIEKGRVRYVNVSNDDLDVQLARSNL